jgi:hypothetical protein
VTQPVLGVVGSAVAMAVSIGIVALFDFATFVGPFAFFTLCVIPMQVVAAVIWGANPPFAAHLSQPAKGVVLTLVCLVAGAILSPLLLALVGEGVRPPGPIPSHFVIVAVPLTFWAAIVMGGWPFTSMPASPVVRGLLVLLAAYVVTFVLFRLFFNYGFLQDAPVYLASAPNGLFHGVMSLVFIVTALAVMFLVLHFDLWPLTTAPAIMQPPVLGLVWTLIVLAGAYIATAVGIGALGMDPMVFLTRVTVPFIFGTIIVLNMLQNSLFAALAQPAKGAANTAAAIVIGLVLANVYGALAPLVTGVLPSGAPGYEYEIWLASALLSVTFPVLIFVAAFFQFWPLARKS